MPTKRQIFLASIALIGLTAAIYVASARMPRAGTLGATALPIGIMDLMTRAKNLPEQQYDAF